MAVGEAVRNVAAQPVSQFSQTAFIFGVLGFAFLFYITLRGDLPKWLGLLGFAKSTAAPAPGSLAGVNSAGGAVPDAAQPGTYGNVIPFPALPQLGTVP